ncbi:MAG: preprotein translocase subunit SecA [Clostridia bacterium]|nr:preprotein translocase subunit SecA [Clostridia bacterium]
MGKWLNKIFGTYSERQIKRLTPLLDRIEDLADVYRAKSDEELKATTPRLKARLAAGETLEDILPDAFAAVREADDRVLGKRPFFVQLIGGILLHQGRIAEMKTGEGKTLVATMPAYLNALTGNGVHIVTVNDYLARCGRDEMGRVYTYLGLKTGLVVHGQTSEEKKEAYDADITYGTNNEFGFDYLRDNMAVYRQSMVQRGHAFAIVDEVDSILIDEARTPLIISGDGEKSTDLYDKAEALAKKLRVFVIKEMDDKADSDEVDADYIVDEKARTAVLTRRGIEKAERFFGLSNLADPENATINHHINQAIRAHGIMKRDVDYVVKDEQVIIVDAFTGRLMPGRRYNEGLHQAIEAKEHVRIARETKTLASITFQNYFRLYKKLSGMTGTAMTEESEFREIYGLDVVEVPTNMPMIRRDLNDEVYRTRAGKLRAIVRQIKECHEKNQPVLVGTVSIERSEELSALLRREGIKHTVLNAKHHEKEAEIVAQAGKAGAVTISTNMAGRGTDIMLGGNPEFLARAEMRRRGLDEGLINEAIGMADSTDETVLDARREFRRLVENYKQEIKPEAEQVKAAGGLFILGTERHESRRINNQLRGRSGRQGDPGESKFFLSLEDDLMRLFGSDRLAGMVARLGLDEDTPIRATLLSGSIETAQKRIENNNFERRKRVLEYDDVLNKQRLLIYGQRGEVLEGVDLRPKLEGMIRDTVEAKVKACLPAEIAQASDFDALRSELLGVLTTPGDFSAAPFPTADETCEMLVKRAFEIYDKKYALFGENMKEVERIILLRCVDSKWMDHIDAMEQLKGDVGLNTYAQRDPVTEYRIMAANMFDDMIEDIRDSTVRMLLTVVPKAQPVRREQIIKPADTGGDGPRKPVVRVTRKIGPNDPCPCGSGRKYKHCHGLK